MRGNNSAPTYVVDKKQLQSHLEDGEQVTKINRGEIVIQGNQNGYHYFRLLKGWRSFIDYSVA